MSEKIPNAEEIPEPAKCIKCNSTQLVFHDENDTEGTTRLKCCQCNLFTTISQERFDALMIYYVLHGG